MAGAILVCAVLTVIGAVFVLHDRSHVCPAAADTSETTTTSAASGSGAAISVNQQQVASTQTEKAGAPLLIAAGGDVIGDRGVGIYIDAHGGVRVFAHVAPLLRDADLTFVNLESSTSTKGRRNTAKSVTFQGRPALVKGLTSAGVDVVSLANNHALDFGSASLLDTVARLDAAGIRHAGAGANATAAGAPAIVTTADGRVAVLAYTDIVPEGFPARARSAGVNPLDSQRMAREIRSLRAKFDYVVVSFHWGIEYQSAADSRQRQIAHLAVQSGADLVLGHHPHVLQGLELYRGRLIAYSLGDFVFDHYSRATGEAFILRARLKPGGGGTFAAVAVYLNDTYGVPSLVSGRSADAILGRLARVSAALGTRLQREGDRLVLRAS